MGKDVEKFMEVKGFTGGVTFDSSDKHDDWGLMFHKGNRRVLITNTGQIIRYSLYENEDRIGGGGGMDIGKALHESLSWLER